MAKNERTSGPGIDATDQELVAACNRGDPAAFEELYRRYRPYAWRIASRFTGDPSLASDVVQDAFMYVIAKFPGFQLTSKMTTFLYPVLRSCAITIIRRQRHTEPLHFDENDAVGGLVPVPPADSLETDERTTALLAAVQRLPALHQEAVLMRYADEMSLQEIGEALAIPTGTVKSRLYHATKMLRDDPALGEYFDPN